MSNKDGGSIFFSDPSSSGQGTKKQANKNHLKGGVILIALRHDIMDSFKGDFIKYLSLRVICSGRSESMYEKRCSVYI